MKNIENKTLSMFSQETLDSLEMAEILGGVDNTGCTNIGCSNETCTNSCINQDGCVNIRCFVNQNCLNTEDDCECLSNEYDCVDMTCMPDLNCIPNLSCFLDMKCF